ncbi:TIGR02206 family membrane protein [Pontibacillus sp. HMF3514]|uniref:YwaF family protein n=1 Tax=Pontibacillus sp. HMF3514 TaxID=2692425 RepID=UPI00131FC6B3|nr:TIGR02206 family membrane protein [Pontibacillus sp. HMF3514]QHE52865.1 TIGR02206 family membrane protein [Pontibacillus sp. HMF3514]
MKSYILPDGQNSFNLFSTVHLVTLLVVVSVAILMLFFREKLRTKPYYFIARFSLFILLLLSEISLHVWLYWIDAWEYKHSLPFHLSSITLLLSAFLLLTRRFSIFEFTYFAGLGSALQAMITPDLNAYTFPHYRYVHFFISHGGTVLSNLFMVFVEEFRPTVRSIWRAFLWLNTYAFVLFFVNLFIGGNYMYLLRKPANPSILDYLGPWPGYILLLEIITIVTFFILYLPFWITDFKKRH